MLERQGHRAEAASLIGKALESHQPFLYKDQAEKLVARLQIAARAAADQAAASQTPGVKPNPIRTDASGPTASGPIADKPEFTKPTVAKSDSGTTGPAKPADPKAEPKGVDPFNDLPPVKP